jgi:hypothetical protein
MVAGCSRHRASSDRTEGRVYACWVGGCVREGCVQQVKARCGRRKRKNETNTKCCVCGTASRWGGAPMVGMIETDRERPTRDVASCSPPESPPSWTSLFCLAPFCECVVVVLYGKSRAGISTFCSVLFCSVLFCSSWMTLCCSLPG